MKEFIEKLIGRLEEEINWYETHGCKKDLKRGIIGANRHAIGIVNELAEEYKGKYVRIGTLEQFKWERDVAIEQLKELGYGLGQKVGWIPCSERLPENDDEVLCWYEYRIMQGTCEGEMKQTCGIGYYLNHFKSWGGEVKCGRDCKVIAWQSLPAPYKKGE